MKSIKIFILFFLLSISSVQAASIYLYPQNKIDNSLSSGKIFSMDVNIDINDILAYQFKLSWDKNILECVKATPHPENLWSNYIPVKNSITSGQYSLAYSVSQTTKIGFTGSTSLVTLQFKVKGTGQTKISFSDVFMFDSKVKNIPFTVTDGSFDNTKTGTIPIAGVRSRGRKTLLGISNELFQPLIVVIVLIVLVMAFIAFKFFAKKK
jgi:hypothetical protein